MKIKFSNFVKLFLAGASLLAVGCTDYGQDIQNLRDDMNDRFDALQTETIDPLRADLTQVQKDLAAAQEAIAAQQLKHDEDVKALQDADEALQKAIDAAAKKAADDLAALASELRGADAKLAEDLKNLSDELNNSIAETNKKVAANEQAIADAVKKAADELAAVKAELEGKLDAESKKLTDLINAEVEKLNNALAQTNAKHAEDIQALQNALAATEALLKQEIADAKEELTLAIAAGDAAVKSELEAKIDALENALNNKIAALESDFNSKIAAANAAISKANEDIAKNAAAIVALEKALADAKAELEKAIADGDAKLAADLAQAVADLTALIEGYVKDLQDQVNAINTEIAGLKTVDADLQNQINALVAALAATNEKVATNAENIAANAEAIAKNADNINHNADAIKALDAAVSDLKAALDSHVAEFVAYKAEVAGLFAAVNAEIAILHAKDAEIEGLIAKLDERLKANEELAAQNAKDIAANKAAFDEYVAATAETLRLMQEAHDALATRVGNLESDLTAHKEAIRKELDEHYAAFADYQKDVAAEFTAVKETLKTQADAIKANADAIEANKAAIADNAAAIAALDLRLTTLEEAHAELAEKHKKLQDDFDAYVAKTDGVIASIQAEQLEQNNTLKLHAQQIADLDKAVKDLDAKVDAIKAELEQKIADLKTDLQKQIDDLVGDLETLKGRIQSLVFVPEHVDGAATVHYAMLGNTLVEGRSTLLYQVYPANCAAAVKAEDLKFVFTDELATSRANAPEFTVVDAQPVPNKEGVVAVTFDARNLSDEFYAGKVKYAVSLVLTTDLVNIASSYVNLAPATADQLDVKLINDKADRIRIEYTDTESKHVVLPEHTYEFSVNGEGAYDIDTIRKMGYEVTVVKADPTYEFLHFDTSAPNIFLYEVDKTNPDLNFVTVSLKEVNKAAVAGLGTVKYSYDVCGKILTAEGQVQVVKIQTKMTLAPQTINWTRSLDNDTDGITPKDPTNRVVTTTAGDLIHTTTNNVVTTTSYADIIAVAPTTVTINGQDMATPYNVVFGGTSDAPTVDFTGFEWGTEAKPNEYNIVATFDLAEMSVTMDVVLSTVQATDEVVLADQTITWNYAQDKESEKGAATFRAVATTADKADVYAEVIAGGVAENPVAGFVFTADGVEATGFAWNEEYPLEVTFALENKRVTVKTNIKTVKTITDLVINLDAAQWLLTKDFDKESKTTDALTPVYEGLTNLGDITADAYLKDVFVDNTYTVVTNTANADEKTNTKMVIDGANAEVNAVYNIDDYTAAIPEKIDYVFTITTWYGQKITFNKSLNIGLTPVSIGLPLVKKTVAHALEFVTDPADSLSEIYDDLKKQEVVTVDTNSITSADEYLTLIFGTHELEPVANLVDGQKRTNSYMSIVNNTTANVTYSYKDFATFDDEIVYTYQYKTWYGQVINIAKTIKIVLPTYDFVHIDQWVKTNAAGNYASKVLAEYDYQPDLLSSLYSFNTQKVDMESAFDVVLYNEDGSVFETYKSVADALAEHVYQEFVLAPGQGVLKSEFNAMKLNYKDYNLENVKVTGKLYYEILVGEQGLTQKLPLPTKFDEGGIYHNYCVERCQFEDKFNTQGGTIYLDNAKPYYIDILSRVQLTDNRPNAEGKYSLLQYTIGNVVYYDRDAALDVVANNPNLNITDVKADFTIGNGTNGFATNVTAADVYLPFKVITSLDLNSVPAGLKNATGTGLDETKLRYNPSTHELFIDGSAQLNLTDKVELDFVVNLVYDDVVYREQVVKITVKPLAQN